MYWQNHEYTCWLLPTAPTITYESQWGGHFMLTTPLRPTMAKSQCGLSVDCRPRNRRQITMTWDDFWALYFCCVVNHAAEKWLSSLLAASCHTVIFILEWKRNLRTLISRNSFSVAWLTVQTASHSSSCLALSLAILSRVYGATCGCQLELCPTAYHSSEIAMITCPAPTSGL